MEHYFDTAWFSAVKFFLYAVLSVTAIGTVLIPTFLNDKMLKTQHNYVSNLSFRNRLKLLDTWGKRFIICFFLSGGLGFVMSQIDNAESKYDAKELFKVQLTAQAKQDSITNMLRDSIALANNKATAVENHGLVLKVQDSIKGVKALLLTNGLQYQLLATELKLANTEKLLLEKEFNRPVIQPFLNPDFFYSDCSITVDSITNIYTFNAFYINTGKGNAEGCFGEFYAFDINSLNFVAKSDGNYQDSTVPLAPGIPMQRISRTTKGKPCYQAFVLVYHNHFNGNQQMYVRVYLDDQQYVGRSIPVVDNKIVNAIKARLPDAIRSQYQ